MKALMNALTWLVRPGAPRLDLGLLILRLTFGLSLAFAHGVPKLFSLERFVKSVTRHGFPLPEVMAPVAMLSELVGGLLLAAGFLTRLAALSVTFTMAGAAFVVHAGDPFAKREKALLFLAFAVVCLAAGAGRYSLDAKRRG